MTNIQKIRQNCFKTQGGRCYYCWQPMAGGNLRAFAQKYSISRRRAHMLRVTAEHLKAKSEGGNDTRANIVAACYFCNAQRHKARPAPTPEKHCQRVRNRMLNGKWHGLRLEP